MPMFSRSSLFVTLIVLGLAGAIALAIWPSERKRDGREKVVPVEVIQAVRQDYPLYLATIGRVQPSETVTLRARVDGMVTRVLFPEGRAVRKGDLLVVLDDAELRIRLAQAEAVLARDEAQLANARTELVRNEQLREKNYVSDDTLRTVRTNVAALEAITKGDRAAVDGIRLQLSYTAIRAPFDGRVGARVVFPGTLVKTNDTTLAVILREQPVQVTFAVPERYLGQLQLLRHGGQLPVRVTSDSDATLDVAGQASFIDNAVDAGSGTIQVKATFANKDSRLTPGAFVRVSLELETLRDVVAIPAAAVQQSGAGSMVYVVDAKNQAHVRPVRVRDIRNEVAIIAEGIEAGETVVASGHLRLTPDAVVQIRQGK